MCQQLHMEESAHEIMQQLGMNTDSRLTFQDFLHFRTQVRKYCTQCVVIVAFLTLCDRQM